MINRRNLFATLSTALCSLMSRTKITRRSWWAIDPRTPDSRPHSPQNQLRGNLLERFSSQGYEETSQVVEVICDRLREIARENPNWNWCVYQLVHDGEIVSVDVGVGKHKGNQPPRRNLNAHQHWRRAPNKE